MLPEIAFLKILMYNKIYNKYYKYIYINKDIYKELYIIYSTLSVYFEKYPDKDTSLDEFTAFFFVYYPRLKQEEIDAYRLIFEQAAKAEVSEEKAEDLLNTIRERVQALEIAKHALAVSEGRKDWASLGAAFEAEPERLKISTTTFVTDDLAELKHATLTKPGLRWRLPSLNRALGSLRKGDFGFVFARPETGKTTFLASEVTHFATQVEQPILWFNNEEQGDKVKLRCFQAAIGLPLDRLFSDVRKYQSVYDELTNRNIKIVDVGILFKYEVERIIEETNPSLIIFDQIDKIAGFAADRNDLIMGAIYQWARQLAKRYAPVIGICQSDGTGEGVQWLSMSNVAEAKTAKQAEADWILGIGRVHDDQQAKVRFLHLSKNKLQGDADSDPEWRHAKWPVLIQAEIARYEDIGN